MNSFKLHDKIYLQASWFLIQKAISFDSKKITVWWVGEGGGWCKETKSFKKEGIQEMHSLWIEAMVILKI